MDEQVTWKGQSFTLLVFGGIVFLCSIFFVLGMLVGRGQGKSAAESAAVSDAAKSPERIRRTQEVKSTNSPYESIRSARKRIRKSKPKESRRNPNRHGANAHVPDKPAKSVAESGAGPRTCTSKGCAGKGCGSSSCEDDLSSGECVDVGRRGKEASSRTAKGGIHCRRSWVGMEPMRSIRSRSDHLPPLRMRTPQSASSRLWDTNPSGNNRTAGETMHEDLVERFGRVKKHCEDVRRFL